MAMYHFGGHTERLPHSWCLNSTKNIFCQDFFTTFDGYCKITTKEIDAKAPIVQSKTKK